MHEPVTQAIALMAVVAFAGSLLLVAGLAAGRVWPAAGQLAADWRPMALPVAALVAVAATASSLLFSEAWHWVPCRLCWFQRIAMYPLALLLPWAIVKRSTAFHGAFITMAVIGLAISTWHWTIEHYPSLADSASCDPTAPCTAIWFEHLGFVTVPGGAGLSFAAIALQLLMSRTPLEDTAT